MPALWEEIAAKKQAERKSRVPKAWLLQSLPPASTLDVRSIPSTCGLLTKAELEITSQNDATSLLSALHNGSLSSEAVTTAFSKRAAIAHQLTNCLTEILFDQALARAKWLDAHLARTGTPIGPLHGLPISLKDTFKIAGYDASIGIAILAFNPAKKNSALVDLLLEAGAVLYCKTNVPQTLQSLDSVNNVFGRTLNPANRLVTAGGSSGGEGALIAMRGSVLGVGTDIGGSIRIPAMCNGLYGIKPSAGRVPYGNQQTESAPGTAKLGLTASAGPLATSMRDCELFLRTISSLRPWESSPEVIFGPWESQGSPLPSRPLIGILDTDNLITPLPPIRNLIHETAARLNAAGLDTIALSAPHLQKCQSLANALMATDGASHIFTALLDPTAEPLTPWLIPRMRRKPAISLSQLAALHARRAELETAMLEIWKDPVSGRRVDAFVCPVAPHPVPPLDSWNGVSYTSAFVLLDYAAGTIPVRTVTREDLRGEMEEAVGGSWDKANRGLWDESKINRDIYFGTPLCIQVVAPRLQERRLVDMMGVIDAALKDVGGKTKL